MKNWILYIISAGCILTSCQDTDNIVSPSSEQDGELINVGGVTLTDVLDVDAIDPLTRADGSGATGDPDAAEKQEWLITPLKQGLDITYGSVGNESTTQKVAILKLIDTTTGDQQELEGPTGNQYAVDKETKWAVYSFKYRESEGEGQDAVWYGNGAHYFEGQYVPTELRFGAGTSNASSTEETVNSTTAPGLHTNQTNKLATGVTTGNYTLLEQYLGMPANTRLAATVARIKLPFRHRLCRVLAYVLIDPAIGQGVTLEGYKKSSEEQSSGIDDPETTELHFSNVDILAGVEDVESNGHHTLTPKWMTARKVVPHFVGERGSKDKTGSDLDENFIVYLDLDDDTYTFPTDAAWTSKKNTYQSSLTANNNDVEKTEKACKIRKINYGRVPVYDIIARPTYTKIENVMYDEAGVKNADGTENKTKKNEFLAKKNNIDFDLTLSNGLQYSKKFSFDLDANYQTVVYLRISPASVDYNSSGAELWTNNPNNDDWYGVDNQNGNSLSIAGSSWQRAYTCGSTVSGDKVTDGGFYNETTTGEDGTAGQYISDATWIKYFSQAYEGGEHHGDYFILAKDITIDARSLPDNFVFTGHLDGYNPTAKTYNTITLSNVGASWNEYIEATEYHSDVTYYDSKPEGYSDGYGHIYELPELYQFDHDVYYSQEECDAHNPELPGYVTTSSVKTPEVKYTQQEINDAVAAIDVEGYTQGSNPEAEAILHSRPEYVKTPAVYYTPEEVVSINTALADFWTTATVKEKIYVLADNLTLSQVAEGVYYKKSEDIYTEYTLPTLYTVKQHTSGAALFAGLNGIYTTKQEDVTNPYTLSADQWEANVHKEKNDKGSAKEYWVPYKGTSTGWRAEVINLKVKGAAMFTSDAVITGNVQNCYEGANADVKVENHTPEYPKYK